ncbi:unnamed protein product [Lathyrus oleraceus]
MRNNIGLANPWLNEEALSWKVNNSEKDPELETKPSEVDRIIAKCCKFDNQINLISEAYHLIYGGSKNLLDESFNLTEIETPMKNSVLHIAAWNGNDEIVTLLIERAPKLLYILNKNNDSVLHVAARAGNTSIVQKLLNGHISLIKPKNDMEADGFEKTYMEKLLNFVQLRNNQGNTMIHEAMLCDENKIGWDMIFKVCEEYKYEYWGRSISCYDYAIFDVNLAKKTILYLAVENGNMDAVKLILEKGKTDVGYIVGFSPLVAAIIMHNQEIMRIILKHQPRWNHSLDNDNRLPLHYAASIAKHGKNDVICYILQSEIPEHHKLINQKDNKGETPLHLAARSCHPSTVYYLVNDKNKRVNLDLVNKNNETALDIVNALYEVGKSSLRQHLTWTALKSAGAKQSPGKVRIHIECKPSDAEESQQSNEKENVSKRYKNRLENLTIVSTLIVTTSVAACLGVPGGADGNANSLNHAMFQFFVILITISFFSSISATLILFWATLGLTEFVTLADKIVMPVLGIALFSLSLAFMAGLYIVISKLTWLANVFLVMTVIFIIVGVLLYILLFLPSSSTIKPLRYISHYPLLYLASRAECKFHQPLKPSGSIGKK